MSSLFTQYDLSQSFMTKLLTLIANLLGQITCHYDSVQQRYPLGMSTPLTFETPLSDFECLIGIFVVTPTYFISPQAKLSEQLSLDS